MTLHDFLEKQFPKKVVGNVYEYSSVSVYVYPTTVLVKTAQEEYTVPLTKKLASLLVNHASRLNSNINFDGLRQDTSVRALLEFGDVIENTISLGLTSITVDSGKIIYTSHIRQYEICDDVTRLEVLDKLKS